MTKIKSFGSVLFYTFLILTMSMMLTSSLQAQQQFLTISGLVQDTGGRGIDGVAITFFDGEVTNTVYTSDGGLYSHQVYPEWSGTVTPQHPCYSFEPASVSLDPILQNTVQNFNGTSFVLTISGVVSDGPPIFDGGGTLLNPLPGVVLTLSTGEITVSGPDGNYSFSVMCGWMGTITPMMVGWDFTPTDFFLEYVGDDIFDINFEGSTSTMNYTISGQVTNERGSGGMDGVEIEFFDGKIVHIETTANGGFYSYTVPKYWAGTITPSLMGFSFTPVFAAILPIQANFTQDFIAVFNEYTLSGIVTDDSLNPLSGVTVVLSTGGTDITNVDGSYSFTLPHGWSGTVTPSLAGWVFEPRKRTYVSLMGDQNNQNYVGYQGSSRLTISGAVKQSDGTGIPGVTLTFSKGGGTATSDDNGDYSKLVLFGWSGTVTPSKAGHTFSPTSRTYTSIKADQVDQDYIDYSGGGGSPVISVSPIQLNFAVDQYGNASGAQSFLVSNSGSGTLNWTISADQAWISFTPSSGVNSGYVSVSVDSTGFSAGTYNGTITVSDPNALNSPQTVLIQLEVYGTTSPPFGDFATPLEGTVVRSSVPFTGWALDDIGVKSVKIYMKENNKLFYIGEAVFVEGARPDVELYYPDYPNNNRAGWGYMMLTYYLPNGGNGTYTFCAIATDEEGHEVTLASRTVTIDNANAFKPFGAIDAPAQGGNALGNSFKNSGWVLTPNPNKIPEDGSTINVYVDGVYLGHPTYNIYREDVATLFPGYANSNGAHAYFIFDTTAYNNGVHTIYWTATDDAGNTDGIGSRFFTILNPDGTSAAESKTSSISGGVLMEPVTGFRTYSIDNLPVKNFEPIRVRRGYNSFEGLQTIPPGKNGEINLEIRPAERVEIELGKPMAGYLQVKDDYRPLPVGSTLDLEKGVFYWLPAPAYYGTFRLVFVLAGSDGQVARTDVTVKIQ